MGTPPHHLPLRLVAAILSRVRSIGPYSSDFADFVQIAVIEGDGLHEEPSFFPNPLSHHTAHARPAPTPKMTKVTRTFCHKKTVGRIVSTTSGVCGVERFSRARGRFPTNSKNVPGSISPSLLVGRSTHHSDVHETVSRHTQAPHTK